MAYSFKKENRYLNLYIVALYSPAGNIGGDCSGGNNVSYYNVLPIRCSDKHLCPEDALMKDFSTKWEIKEGFVMDTITKDKKCPDDNKANVGTIPKDCDTAEPELPDVVEELDKDDQGDIEGTTLCDLDWLGLCASTNLKPIGFRSSILLVILLALIF